ncbi:MAG: acetyl-CoA C-acetyltransferase [Pseudonocardia sp.]|nr:acetyl-CoA C-acetyltransferase [Pseudonocardia sp.]
MGEAYVVDAVRTPVGRRKGGLSGEHPADLGAHPIRHLVELTGVDPAAIDDVVYGCVDNIGAQAGNIGRTCALVAGLPESVPGTTVDRQCGSSQQAIAFAAQAVMADTADLVIAGGVQNMSRYPIMAGFRAGQDFGDPDPWSTSPGWRARYGEAEISQFVAAERIAEKWGISRADMEAFAYESHRRALRAIDEGRFDREIVPYGEVSTDEGPRPDTTREKMAELKPLAEGGQITAAVSSQISDGAAAVMLASERAVRAHGLTPRARIHHLSVRGADPTWVLTAPIPATEHALNRTGLAIGDLDVVEVNEAFAPVVQAWLTETGADPERVNPNGGAIALGHPLGASGARLFTTMLHELERTGGRYGLQTMCEGGGTANVTVIERV